MSVSEWETESEKAAERETVREGYCTAVTNFGIGPSLNGLKLFLSFICIYLQAVSELDPFTVIGEILITLKCKRETAHFK